MATDSIPPQSVAIPLIAEHIVCTPDVCGGRPRIAGHRITVDNIVLDHERGRLSPDEIASRYGGLTLSDVYAALAYYYDHLEEIRAIIDADDSLAAEMKSKASSIVARKLKQVDAQDDPLPSG